MATPVLQASIPPADIVGNAFVHQYYHILHQSPELVHQFYQDVSKLGRPQEDGVMTTTTTMHAINEKILSLGYGEFKAEITTVDSQESFNGGVIVLVTGYLTGNDNFRQQFTQSFFLAPQDKGYFVLNDVFRYVEDTKQIENQDPVNNIEAPLTPKQDPSVIQENHISEPTTAFPEEINEEEEVYNPPEKGDGSVEEEELPVPEVVDEIPDDSQMVADSHLVAETNTKTEEVPKKSYAFIVKVLKENTAPFSAPTAAPRYVPKSQEQLTAAGAQAPVSETHVSSSSATENENMQEGEVEGPSIYVKGLPLDATPALLENEFKKFGPIRPGGVQVRCQKGFCFGFVEFEVASAVQSALEASPIMIRGCRVVVEEKRSTSRGNNRGRFSSGVGSGHRNEGVRGGRGTFGGGKAYSRGDFNNRAEFGNRGNGRSGYSNRGGDGYRRADRTGNNSGRANRAVGLTLNAAAKSTAPQVSATA